MDADWCIMCDTKIIESSENFSSAYCSSDCLQRAQLDARSRPCSPVQFPPTLTHPQHPIGVSKPKKRSSKFTFSGFGLSLDSSSETTISSACSISNDHHKINSPPNLLGRHIRLDSLYHTQPVVDLEQLWTQQFLAQPRTKSHHSHHRHHYQSKQTQPMYITKNDETFDRSEFDKFKTIHEFNRFNHHHLHSQPLYRRFKRLDGERGRCEKIRPLAIIF
ncbi:hypothetical protein CROQUDRAFT_111685 [Cronartium quercuum f. sp. fusiforme G11]|uniref:Uncharacterized protein n=1 Tax=Cronartium quercuum f. sp. fusiforme G11 TaxID=708437 RepID=A0A9P6N8M9_9BASI|nr:hypothetical protein CROQUDRAFT_111685 [Cronartium quercuum f. sp. fusiforme G11]